MPFGQWRRRQFQVFVIKANFPVNGLETFAHQIFENQIVQFLSGGEASGRNYKLNDTLRQRTYLGDVVAYRGAIWVVSPIDSNNLCTSGKIWS